LREFAGYDREALCCVLLTLRNAHCASFGSVSTQIGTILDVEHGKRFGKL
jgi:hypothetical protein